MLEPSIYNIISMLESILYDQFFQRASWEGYGDEASVNNSEAVAHAAENCKSALRTIISIPN